MNLSSLQEGDIVYLFFPQNGSRTLAQVCAVNHEACIVELRLKGQDNHINLDWTLPGIPNFVIEVPITEEILTVLGFVSDIGRLYLLPEEETFWQKNLTCNGIAFYEILKKEQGDWVVVEEKSDAHFGCKFVSIGYLRHYQHYFTRKYGIGFPQNAIDRLFE